VEPGRSQQELELAQLPHLPITEALPSLQSELSCSRKVLLSAPPGSGKTTLVPLALLDVEWLAGRRIVMLEPRRLAARACAARMAELLGEAVGETVGYRVRLESRVSEKTRIEVVTEGILTRRLQQDPELQNIGLLIFDEFHERSLQGDLALALSLDVMESLRDDLRLLVMSATLELDTLSRLLDGAPLVQAGGRSFPVEVHYLSRSNDATMVASTLAGIERALVRETGDLLVFLPGTGEIRACVKSLELRGDHSLSIVPLFGDLSKEDQDRAIRPSRTGKRRVILATSIAETSLTIDGISCVVDSGWSRRPLFSPASGLSSLKTVRVSKASADQRSGRAGRLGPGVCYRLWTEREQNNLQHYTPPEILNTDLASLALELAHWGVQNPSALKWLDPPPAGAYAQAVELLQALEALDGRGRITRTGSVMLRLPLSPRLGHMLIYAQGSGQVATAADLAALLSERDIIRPVVDKPLPVDLELRLEALESWRMGRGAGGIEYDLNPGACRSVDRVSRQLQRTLAGKRLDSRPFVSVGGLLSLAFPDRIARRRGLAATGYRLAAGSGARLPEADTLERSEFLVAANLDARKSAGRIFLAAAMTKEEITAIHRQRTQRVDKVVWDPSELAVVARNELQLDELVIESRPLPDPPAVEVSRVLMEGIRQMGLESLPWSLEARAWLDRVRFVADREPEAWPDFSDTALLANLEIWLMPWCNGISRKEHLKRLDLKSSLAAMLDWERQQQLEQLAPSHIRVPSGSRKRLDYSTGDSPVLAVKLQEMFGLEDSPRVFRGEVAVLLHLLSPAQRPIQVTRDLRGFWDRTYAEVKKELKGRYPKHYWPDNPRDAIPTARVRPKNSDG
jgi:ATP-dependent helicase HrpB